jgi:non-canonical purine NTP pyrophosphatase (RdgB/HAM1 family)
MKNLRLTYVTSNEGKFLEASKLLNGLERLDIDLTEIQSLDPREIIEAKLTEAKKRIADADKRILMVEDLSFVLDGCAGLPGPLMKLFRLGPEGLYKFAETFGNKRAKAILPVGLLIPECEPVFFEGVVEGCVVPPRGVKKFTMDQIFQPDGQTRTYAEMTPEEKNAISHRGIALRKVKEYLESEGWTFPQA